MAKRPTSRSQADDAAAATPAPKRARSPRRTETGAVATPGSSDAQTSETLDALTSESTPEAAEPSEDDIRVRAYHRYLERGGGHGMDFQDWLEAERDLRMLKQKLRT